MEIIKDKNTTVLIAGNGKVIVRRHDSMEMGERVYLGVDYSTGMPREDKPEYYEETKLAE